MLRDFERRVWRSAAASSSGTTGAPAATLRLGSETDGLSVNFLDMSMQIRDTVTPANAFLGDPNTKLTYASPSAKSIITSSGLLTSASTLRTAYDTNGTPQGLLLETTAATNLMSTPDLSSGLTLSNLINAPASITLATGATGGRLLYDTAVTATHFGYPGALSGGLTSATDYAISIDVKASSKYPIITLQGPANNYASAVFDVANLNATSASQTSTGATSGTIQGTYQTPLPNGLVRCTLVARVTGSSTPCIGLAPATTGNTFTTSGLVSYLGTSTGFYIEFMQVETGLYATSRCTGTRAADALSILTSAFNFSLATGTLYAKYKRIMPSGTVCVAGLGSSNYIDMLDGSTFVNGRVGATTGITNSVSMAGTGPHKAVSAWTNGTGHDVSVNGSTANVVTGNDSVAAMTALYFGKDWGAALTGSIYLQELMILPRRMSPVEMQALST